MTWAKKPDATILPATSSRLGGVKIGSGVNVSEDGTISVYPSGGGGGSGEPTVMDVQIISGDYLFMGFANLNHWRGLSFIIKKPIVIEVVMSSGITRRFTIPKRYINVDNTMTLRLNISTGVLAVKNSSDPYNNEVLLLRLTTDESNDLGQGYKALVVNGGFFAKYCYVHGKETIKLLTPDEVEVRGTSWGGRQSINFVNGKLWIFDKSDNTGSVTVVNPETLVAEKTVSHDWWHFNTSDYNKHIDSVCTIAGWGDENSGGYDVSSIIIFHNVNKWGDGTGGTHILDDENSYDEIYLHGLDDINVNDEGPQPVWGEYNEHNNIIYVVSNECVRIRKLLLGKGNTRLEQGTYVDGTPSDRFNGTFKIIGDWAQIHGGGRIQDGFFHNGAFYTAKDAGSDSYGQTGVIIYKNILMSNGMIEKHKITIPTFDSRGNEEERFSGGCTLHEGKIWMFIGADLVKFPVM